MRDTQSGFETIHIRTDRLALAVMPELGGKISSLRDAQTGREWLWRNPRMPYQRVPYGSSYTKLADTGGWDECFPSVMECKYPSAPWEGASIQDHGELWSQPAKLDVLEENDSVTLHSRWEGIALPYTFERKVWLAEGLARLRFDYTVTNTVTSPIDWIWSAHPLIAIEPGMQLLTPPAARFNVMGAFPQELVSQRRDVSFPFTAGEHDLSKLPPTSAGIALKLWSDPLTDGWATLRASDGELRMRWDVTRLPQLALWLNFGAFSGDGGAPYYNMGLEPCIGAQDSLTDAVTQYRMFKTLAAGDTYAWWLEVELAH